MDKVLDVLFWILNAFSDASDPVLAQHRSLQRHWLLSAVTVILSLVAESFIGSLISTDTPNRLVVQAITEPFTWLFSAFLGCSLIWLTWATYSLWRFEREFD